MPKRFPSATIPLGPTPGAVRLPNSTRVGTPISVSALIQRVQTDSIYSLSPEEVHHLQRTIGNRAVQRLVAPVTRVIQRQGSDESESEEQEDTVGEGETARNERQEQPRPKKRKRTEDPKKKKRKAKEQPDNKRRKVVKGTDDNEVDTNEKKKEIKKAPLDIKPRKAVKDARSEDGGDDTTVDTSAKSKKKPKAPAVDARVKRLRRSHGRNSERKAKPQTNRYLLPYQETVSYDDLKPSKYVRIPHDTRTFQVSGTVGMGRAGQPYLNTEYDLYDDLKTEGAFPSDYDELISILDDESTLSDKKLAKMALALIQKGTNLQGVTSSSTTTSTTPGSATSTTSSRSDEGDEDHVETEVKLLPPRVHRALSVLIQLTQLIESHKTRLPGADKWARASLRRIAAGESTFLKEFNRTNGNFLPARARGKKGTLSNFGGQAWGRAMFGLPSSSKTTPTPPAKEVYARQVLKTLDNDYLSSSSDEEQEEAPRTVIPITSVPPSENRPKKVTKKRKRFSDSGSESDSSSDFEDTTPTRRGNSGTRSKAKPGSRETKRKPPRKKRRVENKQVGEKIMETDTSTEKRAHEQDEGSEND